MKKIILILFSFFFVLGLLNIAEAIEKPTEVTFIYINGSNNLAYKNRLKFKVAFVDADLVKYNQLTGKYDPNSNWESFWRVSEFLWPE